MSHAADSRSPLLPLAAALVTFRPALGLPHAVAALWLAVRWERRATLSLAFGTPPAIDPERIEDESFAVHLPLSPRTPLRARRGEQEAEAGVSPDLTVEQGLPLIAGCGERLVCQGAGAFLRFGQMILRGEIRSVRGGARAGDGGDAARFFGSPFGPLDKPYREGENFTRG